MKNLSKFQLILLLVFGAFIVIGVMIVASSRGGGGSGGGSSVVTVWGPYNPTVFQEISQQSGLDSNDAFDIRYVQVAPGDFDARFVNELAEGRAPDLVIISHEQLLAQKSKLTVIPYENYSARDFRDNFIDGAEVYLASDGSVGLPLAVDPLVMYWNRTLFSNAGVTQPPVFWGEFTDGLAAKLTQKNADLSINQSGVALGEYSNIRNAKEILSTLFLQAGTPVTTVNQGEVISVLANNFGFSTVPAVAALDFYTQFANPAKTTYTWSRAMPTSDGAFLGGDVAVYFGRASELFSIRERNPNLNFDVAVIPQSRTNPDRITYGVMYGASIPKMSDNKGGAFQVAQILSSTAGAQAITNVLGLPPVRRDLLNVAQTDPFRSVFHNSAIWSRAYLQPSESDIEGIFSRMIEGVTGGSSRAAGAIERASSELRSLLQGQTY